jgi:hypothetical protein
MLITTPHINMQKYNRSNESITYLRFRDSAWDNSDSEATAQKFFLRNYEVSCEAAQSAAQKR